MMACGFLHTMVYVTMYNAHMELRKLYNEEDVQAFDRHRSSACGISAFTMV